MTLAGFFVQPRLYNFLTISKRIKANEGYINQIYKDKLGNLTIGYGHLVKLDDGFSSKKKYSKKTLLKLFDADLILAISDFNNHYSKKNFSNNVQEVLIEMIYQLGINKTLMFRRFNRHIKNKLLYLAAFEMMNSRWYQQTPKRVDKLITILLNNNVKKK